MEKEDTKKKHKIVTINEQESIFAAAVKMRKYQVGCLIVTDEEGKLAGIVTERDIVKGAAKENIDLERSFVDEIMTREVLSVPRKTHFRKAKELMSAHRIRHLPIIKDDVVVGMFSIRDIMEQQLAQDRLAAEQIIMLSACLRSIDLEEVIHNITSEVPKLFGAKSGTLYLQKAQNEPLVSYNRCLCTEELCKDILNEELSFEKVNLFEQVPRTCSDLGSEGARLVIPLSIATMKQAGSTDRVINGYLCMCGLDTAAVANEEFLKYKVGLIQNLLNAHISNAWRYQDARTASMTDALTQVGSREFLEDKLESECARARRYKQIFSVAIIDLDNFKTINDTLGHAVGDDALRKLAECLKIQKRRSDVLARYGGDEFVVIMPVTNASQALHFIDRLCKEVRRIEIAGKQMLTISCGISERLPIDSDSPRQIMRRADMALYKAKKAGKDCAKVWSEQISEAVTANSI